MSMDDKSKKKPLPAALLAVCDILLDRRRVVCLCSVSPRAAASIYSSPAHGQRVGCQRCRGRSHSSASPEPAGRSRDRHTGFQRNRGGTSVVSVAPAPFRHAGREHVNRGQRRTGGWASSLPSSPAARWSPLPTVIRALNVNVTLTRTQKDGVTCYIDDIYIRNIENLRTAFAENTYGRSITAWVVDMAKEKQRHCRDQRRLLRHRRQRCRHQERRSVQQQARWRSMRAVLLWHHEGLPGGRIRRPEGDGGRRVPGLEVFGPSLLSADGKALSSFRGPVSGTNPRTAIGYYVLRHYVFVLVDGRQAGYSDGMTLAQPSVLFEKLGCKVAYNLDGGKTSVMTFGDNVANQPTEGGRQSSDIIYIGE